MQLVKVCQIFQHDMAYNTDRHFFFIGNILPAAIPPLLQYVFIASCTIMQDTFSWRGTWLRTGKTTLFTYLLHTVLT